MVEIEKTAKQKASLDFSKLLVMDAGNEFDETFDFHGCINTNFIEPILDQEEKILVDDSMMDNGMPSMAVCWS